MSERNKLCYKSIFRTFSFIWHLVLSKILKYLRYILVIINIYLRIASSYLIPLTMQAIVFDFLIVVVVQCSTYSVFHINVTNIYKMCPVLNVPSTNSTGWFSMQILIFIVAMRVFKYHFSCNLNFYLFWFAHLQGNLICL